MVKCYKLGNAGLDANINIATESKYGYTTEKHKKKTNSITYDTKVKSDIEIIYHKDTCKDSQDLVINF